MGMYGHHSKIKGVFPDLKEKPMFEKDKEINMYLFKGGTGPETPLDFLLDDH